MYYIISTAWPVLLKVQFYFMRPANFEIIFFGMYLINCKCIQCMQKKRIQRIETKHSGSTLNLVTFS